MAAGNIDLNVVVRNQQALGKLNRDLDQASKSSLNLGRAAKAAAGALAAIGVGAAIRGIIQTTAAFQDLRTSLSSVTGSAQAGAEAFQFITQFATETQFSVEDLSKSFIKLKAAGIEPTQELLTLFTDTAAITTDQIGTLEAVTDLFARTVSGGLGLEEIQRLGDRGVPVLRILEEQLGLTRNQISEYGKTAEGAQKITEAFAKGIRKEFGGATQALLGNLNVAFSNLGIQVRTAADIFGQGLSPVIKDSTDDLTRLINQNEQLIRQLGQDFGEAAKFAIKNIEGITFAVTALFAVFGKSPLGRVISGLIALGTLANKVKKDFEKNFPEASKALGKFVDQAAAKVGLLNKEVQEASFDEGDISGDGFIAVGYKAESAKESTARLNEELKKLKESLPFLEKNAQDALDALTMDDVRFGLEKTLEGFNLNIAQIDVFADAFKAFGTTASSELTDVILNAKTLDEALGNIARATMRALIQGFINLGITIFILEPLAKWLRGQIDSQKKLNKELKTEIALRTILSFFGGGGGGIPFFANGGRTAANQPIIVGERGPELFVPDTGGEVIPNNELGVGTGDGGGVGDNVNVTFNINTIDATDFDDLLTTRQDLIIGLINRGLAERGKRSLTA